jgi:magnesium-transporting ATPase (P-type)
LDLLRNDGVFIPDKISRTNLENVNKRIMKTQRRVVIVDGTTLALIATAGYIEKDFFRLSLCSSSLICCRVSPD